MCTDLLKCVSCKNDGTEFEFTVYDDSSEVQLWLSCVNYSVDKCCVICRFLVCEKVLTFAYNYLYFESMKYLKKSKNEPSLYFRHPQRHTDVSKNQKIKGNRKI